MTASAIAKSSPSPAGAPLLSIRGLRIEFRTNDRRIAAVPEVSFDIHPGESYGLVGESGCGKTTTAMAVMGYLGNTGRIAGGSILFEGEDLVMASAQRLRSIRGRRIGMVYQDPMSALNPTMTIGSRRSSDSWLSRCRNFRAKLTRRSRSAISQHVSFISV